MAELVNAPPAQSPGYSLLDVLGDFTPTAPSSDDVGPNEAPRPALRWPLAGIQFNPETCPAATGIAYPDDYCLGTFPDEFDWDRTALRLETIHPYFVWTGEEASTFCYRGRDWQGRLRRQLAATLSYQIAHELWTGAVADDPANDVSRRAFTDASETVTDGATNEADAFAQLDAGLVLRGRGARGMIHVTPQLLSKLAQRGSIRFSSNSGAAGVWLSPMNNVVVADAGYTGDGPKVPAVDPEDPPTPQPAGETQWGYATTWMAALLGEVEFTPNRLEVIADQLDRRLNDVRVRIGQPAVIVWDPCVLLAAEFDLPILEFTEVAP